MKDIFISHSSKDIDKVREVCNTLMNSGYSCWVSYSNEDIGIGEVYTAAIADAIRHCKIFIILLSWNSVQSDQVQKEVIMANDNHKYGLSILPILLDDDLNANEYHEKIDLALAGSQAKLWNDDNVGHIVEEIEKLLDFEIDNPQADIFSTKMQDTFFCGRDKEIGDIQTALDRYRKVCLWGIGGVGKTAVAEAIGLMEKTNRKVIFAKVENKILNVIADDDAIKINAKGLEDIRKNSSDYRYSLYKLKLLKKNLTSDDLIIFDNVDLEGDRYVDEIVKIGCRVLLTSRTKSRKKTGLHSIKVEPISDNQILMNIFRYYYHRELSEQETQAAYTLFELANYNTLSIVIMGQQMNHWGERPSDFLSDNQFTIAKRYLRSLEGDNELRNEFNMIAQMIDVSMLARDARIVLKTMTLLPVKGYSRVDFYRMIGNQYEEVIRNLEDQGWICGDGNGNLYLHPIVRELILDKYEIDIEDADIRDFINGFISSIKNCWEETFDYNIVKKNLALAIYYCFPEPTGYTYDKYLAISKFLWVINCMDVSLRIQNKVKSLFVDKNGRHSYTSSAGECALQIGFTYHAKGDYEQAVEELYTAVKIFGNKYAAALAHMAQAKVYADADCTIDDVEWMLSESLGIREKYMPDSLSEAASKHLYAKVLSDFGTRLEEAIEMEKGAFRKYSKIDPESTNVSSAMYILGRLLVQTAEDADDIEDGIEYIEKAKAIRLKHRGDALDPWMEDVYRKLGLSYLEAGNCEKAKEYFELLECLLERKYSNDHLRREFHDNYERLADIHSKLGNADEEKKYRKKQRRCF